MDLRTIRYELTGRVAVITLDRPHRLNAWTGRMHTEYRWCLQTADADPDVRAIVVTGAGKGFCAGADSEALAGHVDKGGYDPGVDADTIPTPGFGADEAFDADFAYHFGLTKPVIACLNGAAAGVGLVLACFCDLRFAAPGVKLTTAHGRLNLPAEYGLSWLLPRLVGVGRALDLLLSSRVMLSEEAHEWGLVNQIHPADELLDATVAYAAALAEGVAPGSLHSSKFQTYRDLHRDVGFSVRDAQARLEEMMTQPDFSRGVAALRSKTPPKFD